VRELGYEQAKLGRRLGITQPEVGYAVQRGATVHGAHRSSTDRRDIPFPPLGTAGLENLAYRAFGVPVNGYKEEST